MILSSKTCFKTRAVLPIFLLLLVVLEVVLCASASADIKLPEPLTEGGSGIFALLKSRASAASGSYPTGQVSQEELSTLLWAASGLNRPGKGWTVPMAMGREPYCKVYVAGDEGTFLYDWKEHSLKEISKDNVKSTIGTQPFVAKASHVLIFVTDGKALGSLNNARGAEWAYVAVGSMTQNVYLAADSLNIGVRYMASLSGDVTRASLRLEEGDVPICIMPIGKR
ncbi:MAG: nitroreductase family protein [Synergistaceae bacterium]|jgi:nitroreductase|nr:nitroreductase family protein [Synergistaceae bacterium]